MSDKLNVVIVDDEPFAVASLSELINVSFANASVIGVAYSASEAIQIISQLRPDVVLLDIHMPGGDGFEVLDAFPDKLFKVIFTTSSSVYALKALKAKVDDYLLKPVSKAELSQAFSAIRSTRRRYSVAEPRIALPEQNGYTYVKIKDIMHLRSEGNYTTVFYEGNKKSVVSKSIKYFEELLHPHHFYRCHQSYIINLSFVKQLKKDEGTYLVMSDGRRVEVSRAHKEEIVRLLNGTM